MIRRTILFFVMAITALAVPTALAEPLVVVEEKLLTSWLPADTADFGTSVAMSGDTLVVGAKFDQGIFWPEEGAVYVYERDGHDWVPQVKLFDPNPSNLSYFGVSVAIDGDVMAVGAMFTADGPNFYPGSVTIFVRNGNEWNYQTRLFASDPVQFGHFGIAVALEGNRLVVGAPRAHGPSADHQGAVYVYQFNGVNWIEQAKLTALHGGTDHRFGSAVAISNGTILAGAPLESGIVVPGHGAAYVFVPIGEFWSQQARLVASPLNPESAFGFQVAIDGETAVVAEPTIDLNGMNTVGQAHVFVRSGETWTAQATLVASDGDEYDYFGTGVDIDGDTLLCGALNAAGTVYDNQGAVYVFTRDGATWTERGKIEASKPQQEAEGGFYGGTAVCLVGDTAVVGAQSQNGVQPFQGAAYVYRLAVPECCKGDMDASTTVDIDDVQLFVLTVLDAVGNGQELCGADMDANGIIDGRDIQLFATKVIAAQPCP